MLLEKKRERIIKQILQKNAENNVQKYSERDLLIVQMEMIDFFIKTPEKINTYLGQNDE